jgi:hypothetical protein
MIWLDIALLFFLEIIEASLQKGQSANALISHLYGLYRRAKLRFFLLHLSLIYVLFYSYTHDLFNGWIALIVAIKIFDLGLKLWIFGRIDRVGTFSVEQFYGVPDMAITPVMRYSGAVLYTLLFAVAIG